MEKKVLKSVKNKKRFHCEFCNYTASQKSHYNKHIQTKKHKKLVGENGGKSVKKVLKSVKLRYTCEICNKQYKDRSGLRYHKKKANCRIISNEESKINNLTNQVSKLANSFNEAVDNGMLGTKNVITNNNISINFFLDKLD